MSCDQQEERWIKKLEWWRKEERMMTWLLERKRMNTLLTLHYRKEMWTDSLEKNDEMSDVVKDMWRDHKHSNPLHNHS